MAPCGFCAAARWQDLPERFPPYQTCHRRFQPWEHDGTPRQVLEALAADWQARGELDLSECFIDGTFVTAKKGPRRGNAQARQGYEAHGGGRPRWASARRPHGVCDTA
jgi:transposase